MFNYYLEERSSLKEVLSDEYLRSIKHLQHLVFRLNKLENGKIVFLFSEGIVAHVLRINTDRVSGKTAKEVFQPDIAEVVEKHFQKAFLGKVVYFELKLSGLIFNTTLSPMMKDGRVAEVFGFVTDITKRKNMEKKLKETEERYEHLVELSPESIAVSSGGELIYINPAGMKLLGATHKHDIIGTSVLDYVHPRFHEQWKAKLQQMSLTGRAEGWEGKLISLDGRVIDVEVTGISITFMDKPAILTITRDVTEQRKTAELLRKSEKLAVVGELAAGVAHEIRNPLTSIKGFLQLLKPEGKERRFFEIMLTEVERIENIIGEFLSLTKPEMSEDSQSDLYVLIDDTLLLLEPQLALSNIGVSMDFEAGIPLVTCEEKLMKQVFTHIMENAIESMTKGGKIKILLRHQDRNHVLVRFIDEGCGISKKRITRIGEPFYAIKEKGIGLGLMVCLKIIESVKGKIHIESQEGKGTRVDVILPIASKYHKEGRECYV